MSTSDNVEAERLEKVAKSANYDAIFYTDSESLFNINRMSTLILTRESLSSYLLIALGEKQEVYSLEAKAPLYQICIPKYIKNVSVSTMFDIKYKFKIYNEYSPAEYKVTWSLYTLNYTTLVNKLSLIMNVLQALSLSYNKTESIKLELGKDKSLPTGLQNLMTINKDIKLITTGESALNAMSTTPHYSYDCSLNFTKVSVIKNAGFLLLFELSRNGTTFYGNGIVSPGNIRNTISGDIDLSVPSNLPRNMVYDDNQEQTDSDTLKRWNPQTSQTMNLSVQNSINKKKSQSTRFSMFSTRL